MAGLLAGEPAEQDRGDLVAPRKLHRGAGVDDHDGVRVDGGDGTDQVVLVAGEPQVGAVEALGLDAFGGADDHDRGVGGAGRLDGLGDQLPRVAARAEVAERERDAEDRLVVAQGLGDLPERDLDGFARGEGDPAALQRVAEEGLAGVGGSDDPVDLVVQGLARDGEGERAGAAGAEDVLAAVARDEGAGDLDAVQVRAGDALGEVVADPLDGSAPQRCGADDGRRPRRSRPP